MNCHIRKATDNDATAISRVIVAALRESNRQDYSAAVIAQVTLSFSPPAILRLLVQRQVYVATLDKEVIATASLDQATVRSVFVAPTHQGQGAGRALMAAVESAAISHGIRRLRVPSSITAEGFYQSLGYSTVRDEYHGEERTIIMEKALTPLA
ncbi:GNAT family N-acetyltransferase [Pseudomonas sp. CFBP 8772]|uniref:GNAT family N-acetyltransferase n=1 Tax=Pseudomonas sp. CFBP 8772 TaxID=2775284 RepID=UPI0017855270|nr:GNAT family N-acetyltransferase [Pseudomonas sp. CFBP 8772]MBD8596503.1 GNAT family N-acetyltransferase [Pseudomonas sp. CFBP 8772]